MAAGQWQPCWSGSSRTTRTPCKTCVGPNVFQAYVKHPFQLLFVNSCSSETMSASIFVYLGEYLTQYPMCLSVSLSDLSLTRDRLRGAYYTDIQSVAIHIQHALPRHS